MLKTKGLRLFITGVMLAGAISMMAPDWGKAVTPLQPARTAEAIDAAVAEATTTNLLEGIASPQPPQVIRMVVVENDALATWVWGEAGGQTVLRRSDETWRVLSSGGGAVDETTLAELAVPSEIALQLLAPDASTGGA